MKLAFQACDFGDSSPGFVAEFNEYFSIERKIDVDTGAEFDKAHVLAYTCFFAGTGIGYYAPGNGSRNLAYKHFLSVCGTYNYGAPFVVGA